jgi:selenocysteine lyase/cysteine desulfurase
MIVSSCIRLPQAAAVTAYAQDFGPFDGRVWVNSAHQGPMPRVAVEAARKAIEQKARPFHIGNDAFFEVPVRLRMALGKLVGAAADDIILGNSTTYGLDLLANGMQWRSGDEVLLVDGDYPANVYPWMMLRDQGVTVRFVKAGAAAIDPVRLGQEISPKTRVFCVSWVSPFTGYAIDVNAIGESCRSRGVTFVLNASQALGARTIDLGTAPVDAFTCTGSKWLCGPYGTGFCWIAPKLRDSLTLRHAYWLAMLTGQPIDNITDYSLRTDLGARAWDVFCTANFFNFMPWAASIEYLLQAGPAEIASYDNQLVSQFLDGLDGDRFKLVSPLNGPQRSAIIVLRLPKAADASAWFDRLAARGVDAAFGEDTLRFSPHLNNNADEVARLLQELSSGL